MGYSTQRGFVTKVKILSHIIDYFANSVYGMGLIRRELTKGRRIFYNGIYLETNSIKYQHKVA